MVVGGEVSNISKDDILRFIVKYRRVFSRRWVFFLIISFMVFLIGMEVMLFQRRTYEATAIVQILHEPPNALGYKELTKNEVRDFEDVNTQLNMFGTKSLLLSILESMSCDDKENLLSPYFSNWKELPEEKIHRFVLERKKINLLRKSYIINISFRHCSATIATMMANKFADFFCDFSLKNERDVFLKSINSLTDNVNSQRKVIENQECELSKYRETYGAISLNSRDDVAHQQLSMLNSTLINKKIEYDLFKNSCLLIEEYKQKGKQLITLPFVCSNNYVENILSALSKQRAEISSLSEKYGDKHPTMICENSRLRQLQSELDLAVTFIIDGIGSRKTKAKREYCLLSEKLKQKESEIIELSRVAVKYNSLLRDLDVSLNLYNTINNRLHEQIAQLNFLMPNVIVIDKALPPDQQIWPDFKVGISAFLLLGLMFGILYIVIAEIFDDRIRCIEDVRKLFGQNVIGLIKGFSPSTIKAGIVNISTKIDNTLKENTLDTINIIGQMPIDLVPYLIDGIMSLNTSVLVITDRPIVFHDKYVPYKEIDGKIGHVGTINKQSIVLNLGKISENFDEKTLMYIHEIKRKYNRVIVSFCECDSYKSHSLVEDELLLFVIRYNSTRFFDIFHYIETSQILPENMYCIIVP